jgi:hypothetical protein
MKFFQKVGIDIIGGTFEQFFADQKVPMYTFLISDKSVGHARTNQKGVAFVQNFYRIIRRMGDAADDNNRDFIKGMGMAILVVVIGETGGEADSSHIQNARNVQIIYFIFCIHDISILQK